MDSITDRNRMDRLERSSNEHGRKIRRLVTVTQELRVLTEQIQLDVDKLRLEVGDE